VLVRQAGNSDIQGLKRSIFLGAEINGCALWGWTLENKGETPLSAAVRYGSLETVKFLILHGANPNLRDGFGDPPISIAAMLGSMDVAKTLIESGAQSDLSEVDYAGRPGKTAVDYARAGGHQELADFLQSKCKNVPDPNR
jgi:ankyrin repeat protein